MQTYPFRKPTIAALDPVFGGTLGFGVKMNNLVGGVNPGICATGTGYHYRFIGDKGQCFFYRLLNTGAVGLPLPATKTTAVVFNGRSDSRYIGRETLVLR